MVSQTNSGKFSCKKELPPWQEARNSCGGQRGPGDIALFHGCQVIGTGNQSHSQNSQMDTVGIKRSREIVPWLIVHIQVQACPMVFWGWRWGRGMLPKAQRQKPGLEYFKNRTKFQFENKITWRQEPTSGNARGPAIIIIINCSSSSSWLWWWSQSRWKYLVLRQTPSQLWWQVVLLKPSPQSLKIFKRSVFLCYRTTPPHTLFP